MNSDGRHFAASGLFGYKLSRPPPMASMSSELLVTELKIFGANYGYSGLAWPAIDDQRRSFPQHVESTQESPSKSQRSGSQ